MEVLAGTLSIFNVRFNDSSVIYTDLQLIIASLLAFKLHVIYNRKFNFRGIIQLNSTINLRKYIKLLVRYGLNETINKCICIICSIFYTTTLIMS